MTVQNTIRILFHIKRFGGPMLFISAALLIQTLFAPTVCAQSFSLSAAEKRVQALYEQERFDDALRVVLE